MPTAEIIAIGTEMLLGEIQDTNTHFLACCLRDNGIDLLRSVIVGDNAERIASAVKEAMSRSQIIITTGGLGPTVDDPTRLAIANALGVDITFHPELWEQIQTRFKKYGRKPTENNRRQAYLPIDAIAIPNPVGTAPAFYFRNNANLIVCLPGVPRELEYLVENEVLPLLRNSFQLQGLIKAAVVHTAGVGESQVDEWIGDLEILVNPTVGLRAHPGQVDIRVTAKANSISEADAMISPVLEKIKDRLGEAIYGYEDETLESVIHNHIMSANLQLGGIECNLGGGITNRLQKVGLEPNRLDVQSEPMNFSTLKQFTRELLVNDKVDAAYGFSFYSENDNQVLQMVMHTPFEFIEKTLSFGGPPSSAKSWATNAALDFLRRNLQRNNHREISSVNIHIK